MSFKHAINTYGIQVCMPSRLEKSFCPAVSDVESDRHYLLLLYAFVFFQCCRSGSGRIGIILADPDRHPGPAKPDP
jgi:hypothetical protein